MQTSNKACYIISNVADYWELMPKSDARGDQWVFYDAHFKSTYTEAKETCFAMEAKLVGEDLVDEVVFRCHINKHPSIT